jgi:glycine/D-amino acid oxidase-like deaminating enzyme
MLGAGIQGICIALELAKNGRSVTIMDQDSKPFNRASLRNEGKIYLGLVYINDPSFGTPYPYAKSLHAILQIIREINRRSILSTRVE